MVDALVTDKTDRRFLFEQFLRCVDREENLIHYRMTWCLQWNLAFLGAFFLLEVNSAKSPAYAWFYAIMMLLSLFGGAVSVVSVFGIRAAHGQTTFLIKQIEKRLGIIERNWSESEFIRPYGDPETAHRNARRMSAFFPLALVFVWLGALVYAFPHVFRINLLGGLG